MVNRSTGPSRFLRAGRGSIPAVAPLGTDSGWSVVSGITEIAGDRRLPLDPYTGIWPGMKSEPVGAATIAAFGYFRSAASRASRDFIRLAVL
jgi:hypothetical protein